MLTENLAGILEICLPFLLVGLSPGVGTKIDLVVCVSRLWQNFPNSKVAQFLMPAWKAFCICLLILCPATGLVTILLKNDSL